jgi:hypothetical protein
MSSRPVALRTLIVAVLLTLAMSLIPLATAFADGGGTIYPH